MSRWDAWCEKYVKSAPRTSKRTCCSLKPRCDRDSTLHFGTADWLLLANSDKAIVCRVAIACDEATAKDRRSPILALSRSHFTAKLSDPPPNARDTAPCTRIFKCQATMRPRHRTLWRPWPERSLRNPANNIHRIGKHASAGLYSSQSQASGRALSRAV